MSLRPNTDEHPVAGTLISLYIQTSLQHSLFIQYPPATKRQVSIIFYFQTRAICFHLEYWD